MVSAWLQLGYSSINLNRTGLRLMDFCYDGWTDRVLQKAPTSTESIHDHHRTGTIKPTKIFYLPK